MEVVLELPVFDNDTNVDHSKFSKELNEKHSTLEAMFLVLVSE